jgi:hypothetical protein
MSGHRLAIIGQCTATLQKQDGGSYPEPERHTPVHHR